MTYSWGAVPSNSPNLSLARRRGSVVAGGDDFLIHVAVPDTDVLYAFVIDRLTERLEVADVRTSVVYEHPRPPIIEAL